MSYLTLRIWGAVTLSLPVPAAIARIAWNFDSPMSGDAWAMNVLLLLAALGFYAFAIALIFRPNFNLLRGLPFRIGASPILTAALAGAIIHFIRFAPSPEAWSPASIVIAVLLLMTVGSLYLLMLWIVWCILPSPKAPSS